LFSSFARVTPAATVGRPIASLFEKTDVSG